MVHFGQHLKELCIQRGVSSRETASYLNTTPAVVHSFESGRAIPTKYQVFKLAGYFNVDAKSLLIPYQKQRMLNEEISENGKIKSSLVKNKNAAFNRYQNMMHELQQLNKKKLIVEIHKPAFPLNMFIENITFYDGHAFNCFSEKVMPDGGIYLYIELDNQERQLKLGGNTASAHTVKNAWVTGVQKQHMTYQLKPDRTILSIRFHPGGFYAVSGIPQTEIKDAVVDAEAIFGSSIIQLREEITEEKDPREVFRRIENYFINREIKEPDTEYQVIAYVRDHIHNPLPSLVRKSGYSQKHLIYLFKKCVGITPKYFQRIARFNNLLNDIHAKRKAIDWAKIAFDNHYFDQSHFIKEFNHLTGMSPVSYLETGSTCSKLLYLNEHNALRS